MFELREQDDTTDEFDKLNEAFSTLILQRGEISPLGTKSQLVAQIDNNSAAFGKRGPMAAAMFSNDPDDDGTPHVEVYTEDHDDGTPHV